MRGGSEVDGVVVPTDETTNDIELAGEGARDMTIHIHMLSGESFALECSTDDHVATLKQMIKEQNADAPSIRDQQLFLQDVPDGQNRDAALENHKTVKECGITPGASVHVVVNVDTKVDEISTAKILLIDFELYVVPQLQQIREYNDMYDTFCDVNRSDEHQTMEEKRSLFGCDMPGPVIACLGPIPSWLSLSMYKHYVYTLRASAYKRKMRAISKVVTWPICKVFVMSEDQNQSSCQTTTETI